MAGDDRDDGSSKFAEGVEMLNREELIELAISATMYAEDMSLACQYAQFDLNETLLFTQTPISNSAMMIKCLAEFTKPCSKGNFEAKKERLTNCINTITKLIANPPYPILIDIKRKQGKAVIEPSQFYIN